jgi:CubicO group peptidase (beta-lactamase class C family)
MPELSMNAAQPTRHSSRRHQICLRKFVQAAEYWRKIPKYRVLKLRALFKTFFFLGVSAILLFGCVGAPPKPATTYLGDYTYAREYLSWMLRQGMAKHDVKGLSIALIDDQRVIWAEGFGYADAAKKIPATPETIYRVGSISKVFTATEVMRLAEHGKVDIDQPLTRYLPEFSIRSRFGDSKPITLRSLLAHHSGLPSDVLKGMWVEHPVSLSRYVADLREESLASSPQTLYKYSNIDYSLLGRVVEKIEGQDFSAAMQYGLLNPLGMTRSSFHLTPELDKRYAKGYRNGEEAERTPLRDAPAGALLSSVNDMSRFVSFLFADGYAQGAQIVQTETLREMFTPQYDALPFDFGHQVGLAWMLSGLSVPSGDRLVWHNGGATPFQAHLSLLPEKKLGVIILANTDEASSFITQVGVKALELAMEAKYGAPPAPSSNQAKAEPVKVPHEILAQYTGSYVMFNGQLGTITLDGDQLKTSLMGANLTLMPVSADTFIPKANIAFGLISFPLSNLSVQFQAVQSHNVAVLHGLPALFAFEKVPDYKIPAAWLSRLGKYRTDTSEEQFDFKEFELASSSGMLVANVTLSSKNGTAPETRITIALKPISESEAVVAGLGNGEGGVIRALDHDNTSELVYSGFHFVRAGIQQ